MLLNLNKYKIVLGSNSPRRKTLISELGLDFEVRPAPGIDESFPPSLPAAQVPAFIAGKKAAHYKEQLKDDELLITADTIVWLSGEVLGKPSSHAEAVAMLKKLSGRVHKVITGVCIVTKEKSVSFSTTSEVSFGELSGEEIEYYVGKYAPFDKAGAYGIQEWIGYIGVEAINGSFYNVMGLPVQRLYRELKAFVR